MRPHRPVALTLAALAALAATADAKPPARPDLAITKLGTPPASVVAGKGFKLAVVVADRGPGRAGASRVALLLSRDARADTHDTALVAHKVKALRPRKHQALTLRATVPRAVAPGTYRLLACADRARTLREVSEANNCRAAKRTLAVRAPAAGANPIVPGLPSPLAPLPAPVVTPTPTPTPAPTATATPTPTPTPTATPIPPGTVPVLGAPSTLPPGAVASLKTASAFLYEGSGAVQQGVQPGAISSKRAAVMRGVVQDAAGDAVPGVRIVVVGHPEYGATASRADGRYDMVVNGARLQLDFEKDGYLPVQRQVDSPWQDYIDVDPVAMTPLSPVVTAVDPGSAAAIQVAQGAAPPQGGDPSTLLFPQADAATMHLADGTTRPLDAMHVRITEFPAGQQSLPGTMPGTVGPTYAAEFSIDEAQAAGATTVTFAKPVIDYTDNFIHAPVGSSVPTASYDRTVSRWVPEHDGRVIRIATITGGKATLDGADGLTIGDAELTELGSRYHVGDELWRVPITHFTPWDHNWPYGPPPGAVPPKLKEFEWKDPNDPCNRKGSTIACEAQTVGEDIPVAGTGMTLDYMSGRQPGYSDDAAYDIPVTSASVPDKLQGVTLDVDVAGHHYEQRWCDPDHATTGPSTCQGLPALGPNLTYHLDWDGTDAYGRTVEGRPLATVTETYVYEFQYYGEDAGFDQSFGQIPSGTQTFNGAGYCGNQNPWLPNDLSRRYQLLCGILVRQTVKRPLGHWDVGAVDALGGLTLSVHHGYDPQEGVLYRGDGTSVHTEPLGSVVDPIAGGGSSFASTTPHDATDVNVDYLGDIATGPDGSVYGYSGFNESQIWRSTQAGQLTAIAGKTCAEGEDPCPLHGHPTGDGGPAIGAVLGNEVRDLAVAPDGSVYFTATDSNDAAAGTSDQTGYVRRISPSGALSTIAGVKWRTASPSEGDGGPAAAARVDDPRDIDVGPDGSIYFTERAGIANGNAALVRRISPSGIVTRVAGGGTEHAGGDLGAGERATARQLGNLWGVVAAPDGTLYLADPGSHLVQKVAPDGTLTRVVGDGTGAIEYGSAGENAGIGDPTHVALGSDGTLYVRTNSSAEGSSVRIVRIARDATVTPVAGLDGPQLDSECGFCLTRPGDPAARELIRSNSYGLETRPDGTVLYTDGRGQVIALHSALPGFQPGNTSVPSTDGSEVYIFDDTGRHLRTLDGLTGATRWTFAYDDHARLVSATDGDGNATTIERAADGTPQAIVAPGGQRTTLALDAGGRVDGVTDPAGETTSLTYHPGGLIDAFTRPGGRTSTYGFDGRGRLTSAESATGGVQHLAAADAADGRVVTVTDGEGRATTYTADVLPDGDRRRVVERPSGATTTLLSKADGTQVRTDADGTSTTETLGPDPRWGMRVPVAVDDVMSTPSGKSREVTTSVGADLASPGDPFSLDTLTMRTTIAAQGSTGEQTSTSTYSASGHTITLESPTGRRSVTTLDARGRVVDVQPDAARLDVLHDDYDARGRLTKTTQGDQSTTYAYDGGNRLTSTTDAAGATVTYDHDAVGRVTAEHLPGGRTYQFGHAAGDGRLQTITMPSGAVHHVTVDGEDQVTAYEPPSQPAYTRAFDHAGAITAETFPSGRRRTSDFDAGGLETTTHQGGAETDAYAYPSHDDRPSTISRTPDGGSAQGLTFAWDGLLPAGAGFTGPAAGSYAYRVGDDLRPDRITLTSGADTHPTDLAYDDDGLPTQVGAFTLTRDGAAGQVSAMSDGTLTAAFAQDGAGRLASRELRTGGTLRYGSAMTYDARGRIATRTETVAGTARTLRYAYDDVGELTQVSEGATVLEQYGYDADGNRTSRTLGAAAPQAATYDAADRLTGAGGTSYTFDDDGFLTHRGADAFTYAVSGDLLSATVGGTTVTYAYDAIGRRTARTVGASTEQYLYGDPDDPFRLTASRAADGTLTTYDYDDQGALIAYERGAATTYVGSDENGTPVAAFSADGTPVETMTYDAFGRRTADTGPGAQLPIGFAGGLADPVTGLVRFGLRDYDPDTGRFTARDPSLFGGSPFNLYAYAGSDPVGRTDPTGLYCIGASFYSGAGGGISYCHKNGKDSVCGEIGVGAGAGVSVDPFSDVSDAGGRIVAEVTEKFGPVNATIGGSLDLGCFNLKGSAGVGSALLGTGVSVDTTGQVSATLGGSSLTDFNGTGEIHSDPKKGDSWAFKTEGKIAAQGCVQY